ncbi:MAG: AAA family ATPase [Gemmataceae bacterium]|nr:AAA family ATPase [Gemmataceae bacterium]
MIKNIRIRGFKSLEDVTVALEPVTVLIGRTGSGKSNFVQAIRFLRDFLTDRNPQRALQLHGGHWLKVICATATDPIKITFSVGFAAPGFQEGFAYFLSFRQAHPHGDLIVNEEHLALGGKVLFHSRQSQWVEPPPLINAPAPTGTAMLGALTGVQESTIAHLVLTNGIGCYAFPDNVLMHSQSSNHQPNASGLRDDGGNFLPAFTEILTNLQSWRSLLDLAASLRKLKSNLRSLDLEQPSRQRIAVTLESEGRRLVFPLDQESEGFRRLLACLLALYQTPPKQTVLFDEPEKGIFPPGLPILAEEFKNYASQGRGQVILTTHSPEFLDHFEPEQIRVVEMAGFGTRIGRLAPEQTEAIRERYLKTGELLTVDPARLAEPTPVE